MLFIVILLLGFIWCCLAKLFPKRKIYNNKKHNCTETKLCLETQANKKRNLYYLTNEKLNCPTRFIAYKVVYLNKKLE